MRSMRCLLADPAPEAAEVYGAVRFWRMLASGHQLVKAWRGKASRPYAFYRFATAEARERWIADQKAAEDSRRRAKVQRRAAMDQQLAAMCDQIQVGTILHYSWGWEQTNCDFFQVVARSGRKVTIRPIQGEEVSGGGAAMSCQMKPVRDSFCGDPIDKMIMAYGVTMDHGHASPTTDEQTHYCSWYA